MSATTFYIYIINSVSSGKYYTGYSSDPWRRLEEHNFSGHDSFTSKHRPWQIKAVFKVGHDEAEAIRIERFIKRQKSSSFLQKLINPTFIPVGLLAQLVRVPQNA